MKGQSRFRSSFTYMEGYEPADWVQAKIINTNRVNWTVDVVAQFDRKYWFDIQVGSPYMHYNNGEGISIFPEVGSKCMVCLPSDSSPPFVGAFIMPVEVTDMATADAPQGTTSQSSSGAKSTGASFAGGRDRFNAQPGDIWMRTRDDNFVVLHRGGVVQIGATELAQRIYIPVGHLIMDVSQNYAHHNAGGSILWSLQTGPALTKYPSEYTHSFRIYANDIGADIRVKAGKVSDPIAEPSGSAGNQDDISNEKLGKDDNFIIYEVDVAPLGFNPETGAPLTTDISKQSVLRFFFDRGGGAFLRCEGSLVVASKKRLLLRGDQGIDIKSGADLSMSAASGMVLDGGNLVQIKGTTVRVGPGGTPVAMQGSMVQVTLPYTPMPVPGGPPMTLMGVVLTGEPSVLV